jgi:hypothetical protein
MSNFKLKIYNLEEKITKEKAFDIRSFVIYLTLGP